MTTYSNKVRIIVARSVPVEINGTLGLFRTFHFSARIVATAVVAAVFIHISLYAVGTSKGFTQFELCLTRVRTCRIWIWKSWKWKIDEKLEIIRSDREPNIFCVSVRFASLWTYEVLSEWCNLCKLLCNFGKFWNCWSYHHNRCRWRRCTRLFRYRNTISYYNHHRKIPDPQAVHTQLVVQNMRCKSVKIHGINTKC